MCVEATPARIAPVSARSWAGSAAASHIWLPRESCRCAQAMQERNTLIIFILLLGENESPMKSLSLPPRICFPNLSPEGWLFVGEAPSPLPPPHQEETSSTRALVLGTCRANQRSLQLKPSAVMPTNFCRPFCNP